METKEKAEKGSGLKKFSLRIKKTVLSYFRPQGIQIEMLRYRGNKVSQSMTLIALCFVVAAFCTYYGYTYKATSPTWGIGVDIVFSILLVLFSFLAMQETKAYSKIWGYIEIGIGIAALVRTFIYPLSIFNEINTAGERTLDSMRFTVVLVFNTIGCFCYVVSGVLSIVRGNILRKYLSQNKAIENEIIKG